MAINQQENSSFQTSKFTSASTSNNTKYSDPDIIIESSPELEPNEWLTKEQVSQLTNLSLNTINGYLKTENLSKNNWKVIQQGKKPTLIYKTSVLDWLEKREKTNSKVNQNTNDNNSLIRQLESEVNWLRHQLEISTKEKERDQILILNYQKKDFEWQEKFLQLAEKLPLLMDGKNGFVVMDNKEVIASGKNAINNNNEPKTKKATKRGLFRWWK